MSATLVTLDDFYKTNGSHWHVVELPPHPQWILLHNEGLISSSSLTKGLDEMFALNYTRFMYILENCSGRFHHEGNAIYFFEDLADAILFKLWSTT